MSKRKKTKRSFRANNMASGINFRHIAHPATRPYLELARIDKPIGTWLLLLPCWWGIALAGTSDYGQLFYYGILFSVGAFVMRGAGCVWNDILDRNIDAKVARTASRPIASGKISVRAAVLFLIILGGIGFLLLIQLNKLAIIIGVCSLGLVGFYPLMKRITYWPQAWLGLTFNWGALVGWVAITGSLNESVLCLYMAGFFWTLGYDTIYAHQDIEDDILIGVRSTAVLFGKHTKYCLAGFYILALIMFSITGYLVQLNSLYFIGLCFIFVQFSWQIIQLNLHDPKDCFHKFQSNKWAGILITFSILIGHHS